MSDRYYICEGCKAQVDQSINGRLGRTVNCCAYGCHFHFRHPCRAYDIYSYTYDRLKEEGLLKDTSNPKD